MNGAEKAALTLTVELLKLEADIAGRDALRRQDRLKDLDPAGDTWKQEQYEIVHAQGRGTGLAFACNRLEELLSSFDLEVTRTR